MKKVITYRSLLFLFILMPFSFLSAQKNAGAKAEVASQEINNYMKLKNLGYAEKEIFEDLGNANFLLEKYENALYWYKKLIDLQEGKRLSANYQKRYQYALEQTMGANTMLASNKDWVEQIKEDYQLKQEFETRKSSLGSTLAHKEFDFQPNLRSQSLEYLVDYERNKIFEAQALASKKNTAQVAYEEPIAVTADGKTAYFSKQVYLKPIKGIFSKKELVSKIYRTDKINGQWKNVREVALAPKNYSVKHPTVSNDGDRLYFASNMPGSFGKYDIYAADIKASGDMGVAKNLGKKVNTKKNDLYPRLVDENTLVFASEGRDGYGGLDLYMSQVGKKKIGWATNLGSPINSSNDDFSMYLMADRGIGYVLSNRGGNKDELQEVAFSYSKAGIRSYEEEKESNLMKALNNKLQIDYTTSVFEDK